MPVAPAATKSSPAPTPPTTTKATALPPQPDEISTVRLHVTPFTPALLKAYLAPSVVPLAKNISYHYVETFPEKGFGYLELPTMEAQKLKKKLNGATLKGSKVKIEEAKPEKRKALSEDPEAVQKNEERPAKRVKKAKKEQGVLEGVELPDDRKVKRGWTEPAGKNKKDKRDKKGKQDSKTIQKDSKYTKEPEMLFKAKLTPVAATELAHKEKKDKKKDKKQEKEDKKERKNKSRSKQEVTVHEFKKNKKEPSFLRTTKVSTEKKPPVEYINGQGWVDEDGNVVEAETGKARNRRVLELVDSVPVQGPEEKKPAVTPEPTPSPKSVSKTRSAQKGKKKKATPPPSSSESEADDSSVVSSSSSESESGASGAEEESEDDSFDPSPAPAASTPQIDVTPSSAEEKKEVHPLEALFKRPRPSPLTSSTTAPPTSAPAKGLAPINTSFSFFDNENTDPMDIDADAGASENPPTTPFTQRDLEWRGLRSAAPTPDTATIGRRFSFPWRKGSQEVDDEEGDDDIEAGKQLSNNTRANSSVAHLPGLVEEEDEDVVSLKDPEELKSDDDAGADADANTTRLGPRTRSSSKKVAEKEGEEAEESEFGKWFWENRGENNRAWKKRRRETLKAKRLRDNKKVASGGRVV
ncbi:hypothetical protein K504DRAFT_197676 [Pleomassaria siparia CBS 279.74]|uniref:Uncharacterized protein n=1 Tax=Pleomassaria siparia CBS 279.74 TaxID=1314801 RepID=A0A6G1KHF2_9PLEO|nr:hypothetical protein K504DRAFT_197676 [Pleomassaria siparia CBS 279.74]